MFSNVHRNTAARRAAAPGPFGRPALDHGVGARACHCQPGIRCWHLGDRRLGHRLERLRGPRRLRGRRHAHLAAPHEGRRSGPGRRRHRARAGYGVQRRSHPQPDHPRQCRGHRRGCVRRMVFGRADQHPVPGQRARHHPGGHTTDQGCAQPGAGGGSDHHPDRQSHPVQRPDDARRFLVPGGRLQLRCPGSGALRYRRGAGRGTGPHLPPER